MSIRLNKYHKEQIAEKARNMSPLNKELEEHRKGDSALAEKLRVASLGGIEATEKLDKVYEQLLKIREELPEEVLGYSIGIRTDTHIPIRIDDDYHYLNLNKAKVTHGRRINIDESSEFYDEVSKHVATEQRLRKELKDLYNTVYASIQSITTVKKLLDTWEEAKELLPEDLKAVKVQLPALQTHKLNKAIGLPSKKATN